MTILAQMMGTSGVPRAVDPLSTQEQVVLLVTLQPAEEGPHVAR